MGKPAVAMERRRIAFAAACPVRVDTGLFDHRAAIRPGGVPAAT
jgi:hypothetical protein